MKIRIHAVVSLFVVLAGGAVIGAGVGKSPGYNSQDKVHPTQHTPEQPPPILVDGSLTPDAIPDRIAYEFFFTSIYTPSHANEIERKNARALARLSGLDDTKVDWLLQSAIDLRQKLNLLDSQAAELKDRHWPYPSNEVLNRLDVLQKEKEAMFDEVIARLPRVFGGDGQQLLSQRIIEIKKKVKVYQQIPIEAYRKQ